MMKQIHAMFADRPATPESPSAPAINAITKKTAAQ
jgi:hypothetical protein